MKWKYPGTVILTITAAESPTLGSESSEYSSIFRLNDSESWPFIEAQILPWLTSEIVITASVDHIQL